LLQAVLNAELSLQVPRNAGRFCFFEAKFTINRLSSEIAYTTRICYFVLTVGLWSCGLWWHVVW